MIEFDKMRQLLDGKNKEITSLAKEELTILQGFASYSCDQIVKFGLTRKASVSDIAVNSFRAGVALGLGVKIEGGKLVER